MTQYTAYARNAKDTQSIGFSFARSFESWYRSLPASSRRFVWERREVFAAMVIQALAVVTKLSSIPNACLLAEAQ